MCDVTCGIQVKILLLNQTFYPDVVSTGQHLSELASILVKRGHSVTVVTGRQAYDNRQVTFAARENWGGVEIFRVYSTGYRKKTKWRRVLDFGTFIFSCCARLAMLPRHDVVVALTTPPLISFIGAWRARLWRSRFCYWVMDFNPDEAIAAAQAARGKVLRLVAEPGGAAALAAIVAGRYRARRGERVGVLVCGANTTAVSFG